MAYFCFAWWATTDFIFPAALTYVDFGSANIMAGYHYLMPTASYPAANLTFEPFFLILGRNSF